MTVERVMLEFGGYEEDFSRVTVRRMAEEILRLREQAIKTKDLAETVEE